MYHFEEFYLLGYNSVEATESQPKFQRNMSSKSSGSKNKSSRKPEQKQVASKSFHAGFSPGLFLDPEDGGDMFI
jgi:hypothetical protein